MIRKIKDWHELPRQWEYVLECGHTSGYDTFDDEAKEDFGNEVHCCVCSRLEEDIKRKADELDALKAKRVMRTQGEGKP